MDRKILCTTSHQTDGSNRGLLKFGFLKFFLPIARASDGTKVLIGDNLRSHFSPSVIKLTLEINIKFIFANCWIRLYFVV